MKAIRSVQWVVFLVAVSLLMGACGPSRAVSRRAADADIDLSGKWNAKDSQLLAKQLIEQIVNEGWLEDFLKENKRKPMVMPIRVKNRTSEHIDTQAFVNDVRRALIKSRKVRVVSSKAMRDAIRAERADQQRGLTARPAKLGKEAGADFVLTGELLLIQDRAGGLEQRFYQGNMELISVETNEVVWIGDKKINKLIDRKKTKL